MDDTVLDAYIGQLLSSQRDADEVVVAFQGGEPTMMGLDFFRRVLEREAHHAAPGQKILNTIQTNATLIDDDWAAFLKEHDFLVGVSIDGPREMHDAFRVDKGGKPTFDRVLAGLDALKRHDVEWNALTTINAANQDHGAEVYRFLRDDLGATFVQLIPIVERVEPVVALRHRNRLSPALSAYGRFLIDIFEEWARHDVGDVFVQMFDTALAHWLGMEQAGMCVHARTCGDAVALEHNGDLYSCDHYVDPEYLLGNIAQGKTLLQLVDSPQQRAFGQAKLDTLPDYCRKCDVRFACNGGCPKDRFIATPDGEPGLHYLCAGYQMFFRHIDQPMKVAAGLLRRGQDATGFAVGTQEWTPNVVQTPPVAADVTDNGLNVTVVRCLRSEHYFAACFAGVDQAVRLDDILEREDACDVCPQPTTGEHLSKLPQAVTVVTNQNAVKRLVGVDEAVDRKVGRSDRRNDPVVL